MPVKVNRIMNLCNEMYLLLTDFWKNLPEFLQNKILDIFILLEDAKVFFIQ
jgi:hypothetical protein